MTEQQDIAHFNMLEQQVRPTDVSNSRVLYALEQVKRVDFVDESLARFAYADMALPMGYDQVMLPPILQSKMLQAVDAQDNETVLEIGTGTGYLTALLATLAKRVTTVELVPELSTLAEQNLASYQFRNIAQQVGDASDGWSLDDRVDVIVMTAAFVSVPESYLQQLQVGGRLLAIVGEAPVMEVQLIHRVAEREWQTEVVMETLVPSVTNAEPEPAFEF